MASTILAVPDEHLVEFIEMVREGISRSPGSDMAEALLAWCNESEEYLRQMKED